MQYRSNMNYSSLFLTLSMISCSPKLHNELETFLGELMITFQHDGLPYPQNFPVWSKPVSALKPSRDEHSSGPECLCIEHEYHDL